MSHYYTQFIKVIFLVLGISLTGNAWTTEADPIEVRTQGAYQNQVVELLNVYEGTAEPKVLQLITVGDIMMHEPQISSGYNEKTKTYNYDYMYEEVAPYLKEGDLTIGNLELTLSGANQKYTGYPRFNAPDAVADALKKAGFDLLTTANNHSLDRKFAGIERTISVLEERGLLHTGTYRTEEQSQSVLIQEVKGTKIAFLAYTYGTNGIKVDKGKEYSVNYINQDKITKDIKIARQKGAELICVSVHWGVEYMRTPHKAQKQLVDFLVEQGVDIILGSHPHVLQPIEIREAQGKETVILYSQGNFISGQRTKYRETSAIFNIFLEKEPLSQTFTIKKVSYIPTWVDYSWVKGKPNYRVLPAKRAVHLYELGQDSLISKTDCEKLKGALKDVREMFRSEDKRIVEQQSFVE